MINVGEGIKETRETEAIFHVWLHSQIDSTGNDFVKGNFLKLKDGRYLFIYTYEYQEWFRQKKKEFFEN